MIEKEFIPYEQALELAKLNFNEKCFGYYGLENELYIEISCNLDSNLTRRNFTAAPTYQQAFRWFREKYKIGYNITWNKFYENTPYQWEVRKYWENEPTIPYGYAGMSKTYEEAELACLNKLIEITKTK